MKIRWFTNGLYVLCLVCFWGCVDRVCKTSFYVDCEKDKEQRYSMIKEKDYAIQVDVEDTCIDLNIFTSKFSNIFINDRGVDFEEKEIRLILVNTLDTLVLINKESNLYSCKKFKKKIEINDKLNLKIAYNIDSLGIIKNYVKDYNLIKRKNCHFMFRVH